MKGMKSFFERYYTHSLKLPTIELGDARPCVTHFCGCKKNLHSIARAMKGV
jgi:hypothetical protein